MTSLVYLSFSKAFGNVSHNIFIHKQMKYESDE